MSASKTKSIDIDDSLILKYLQQITNCLAYLVMHTEDLKGKSNNELIPILASFGFDSNAIATILRTTPGTVRVRLSNIKATTKGKKSSKEKPGQVNESSGEIK